MVLHRSVIPTLFFGSLSVLGWSQKIQSWGLKIGPTLSNETWHFNRPIVLSNYTTIDLGTYSWDSKIGYTFSAFVEIPFRQFIFAPQISFIRKGYHELRDFDIRDNNNVDLGRVRVHDVALYYQALELPLQFFP